MDQMQHQGYASLRLLQYQGDYDAVCAWSGQPERQRLEQQTYRGDGTYKRLLIHAPRLSGEAPQVAEVGDWLVKGDDGVVRVQAAAGAAES